MILAGDFIPKNLNVHLPDEFKDCLVLANLEGPICDDSLSKSSKVGFCLHSNGEKLRSWGVERFAFSLANNHMMDFGEEGLRQTKAALASLSIPFAGAGVNEEEARQPMILEENGKRIAVFSCSERQFGMATEDTAGCAAKGAWLYEAIRGVKALGNADFVIVSCHAANEYSPWVSPSLHDFYHSLVDAGADCIHGHHAHVPQGYEEYKGKPIFYGLGNFVVDPTSWSSNANQLWSIVGDVNFAVDRVSWSVTPYCVQVEDGEIEICVRKADGERLISFHSYLACANRQFESRRMLVSCWQEASVRLYRRVYEQLLRAPSVENHRLSMRDAVRKLTFAAGDVIRALTLSERRTNRSLHYAKVIYNYFNCQSHVETVAAALGVLTESESDLRSSETCSLANQLGVR